MPRNIEMRNIRSEGGDVRFEEIDLDVEREKKQDAEIEAAVAVSGVAQEYADIANEAKRLLEVHGQNPDLSVSLSGLSEIKQAAGYKSIELRARAESDMSPESILNGKTTDTFRDDHEAALEGMWERLKKMKIVAEAVTRQEGLVEARSDIEDLDSDTDELQIASEIARDTMFEPKSKADQASAQKEREAILEAAQKKLDLKTMTKLLGDVKTHTPTLVSENINGLNKLLDGDGKKTLRATIDINTSISQSAAELSRRLSLEIERFMDADIDVGEVKQLISNLKKLAEDAKKRADQAITANRGVSKLRLGALKEQSEKLEDVKLLFSPNNASGKIVRDGKSVDASKRLAKLRQG